jgi:hypothetical protein
MSIGSLIILGIGMYYSFKDTTNTAYMTFSFLALIVGFIIFQVGNYFSNRWGKSPRPDEIISASLKGLDDKYFLYHYSTDVSHLLVGPSGITALLPYPQGGSLIFDPKRKDWIQKGGSFFMKAFAQEGLGRPNGEADLVTEQLKRYLTKIGVDVSQVKCETLIVFTNENAEVNGEGSPIPYTTVEKIKDYIRKQAKSENLTAETVQKQLEPKLKMK